MKSPSHVFPYLPLVVCLFAALCLAERGSAQESAKPGQSRLIIESFGPSRAYAVGQSSITLIATVRNVGDAALAEGSVGGRLTCVSGLEYAEGDTIPKLPALAPNAVMNFRWRVTPTNNSSALVAAFALEYPNGTPDIRVAGIQRLSSEPNEGAPSPKPTPIASARNGRAVLENGRLRARVETTAANVPGLWLTVRTPSGWKRAGVSLPLAEVLSAEGGQQPWWEIFRSEGIRAINGDKEASLLLTGGMGLRWRATITMTLRADSSVLDYDIRLAPLRTIKISGLRMGTFHVGDGSFGADMSEELPYSVNGDNAVAAVRYGEITIGGTWPTKPLFPGWQITALPPLPGADYQILGAELSSTGASVELKPGALVDFHCRLYALTPTATVRTAFNILVPATRNVARPAPQRLASRALPRSYTTSRRALIIKREGSNRKKSVRSQPSRSGKKTRTSQKSRGSAKRNIGNKGRSTRKSVTKRTATKRNSALRARSRRR